MAPGKSQPSGPPISGNLGKPRFLLERWTFGLGFSCPTEHQWCILFNSHSPYQSVWKTSLDKWRYCFFTLKVSYYVASQRIKDLLGAFLKSKNVVFNHFNGGQWKIINYLCEDEIEKSVPRNHRLSSLGKPRNAKWRSSGPDFLSHPQIW